MLADAAAAAFSTRSPHPLVLADAAAAAFSTPTPHPIVLADAAATAVCAQCFPPPVLAGCWAFPRPWLFRRRLGCGAFAASVRQFAHSLFVGDGVHQLRPWHGAGTGHDR